MLNATGNIGTSNALPFQMDTPSVLINGTNQTLVINTNEDVVLQDSTASGVGAFVFHATGNLSVNDVTLSDGSIDLTSDTGKATLLAGALVSTANGNVNLASASTNKKKSVVELQAGSAISASGGAALGDITISVGTPQGAVAGKQPKKNLVVNAINNGQVFFGKKGITLAAPTNTFNVDNTNIFFNNFISKKSILIDGNVTLTGN